MDVERQLPWLSLNQNEVPMRLYYSPGACSLAPHIVAREAGLDIELARVDIATKRTQAGEDYLNVNRLGLVPSLLLDDGTVLTEAGVVTQYLADRVPEAHLLPPPGFARYRALEWLNFIATELHKGFSPLWKTDTPAATRELAKEALAVRFGHLDRSLAGQDFLLGAAFSAPDAYAFTVLSWARFMKIDLARWPNVIAYLERVGARPKVREALVAEGILKAASAAA